MVIAVLILQKIKIFSQSADTKQHIKNEKFILWSIILINLSQGKVHDFSVEVQDDAHLPSQSDHALY
jgi:hypothetical protein